MKKQLHVPRGSTKSYVEKIKDAQGDFVQGNKRLSTSYYGYGNHLVNYDLARRGMLDNQIVFCNWNNISSNTKKLTIFNCNFAEVKDEFKVMYICKHCRHKQQITNTDLILAQFIHKNIQKFADMRIFCGACSNGAIAPTRSFIKNILVNYTQEPIEKFNLPLPELINKLNQIVKFDLMLNGKDTYLVQTDSLRDLIYD